MSLEPWQIEKGAIVELSRMVFYEFCQTMAPDFYKPDRRFLTDLCNDMQSFVEGKDEILIINAPPRFGKSRSGSLFCNWYFGHNPETKIMIGSYNETLSETFSMAVRNLIDTSRMDETKVIYNDIFPNVKIKKGDGAVKRWSIEGQHASYLATSPTGTATGFGANLLLIDDLLKSAEEANNANVLEKTWSWFTDTMLSRLEEGGKIIIIMTRWHSNDLAGRALKHFDGKRVKHISLKALQDDGTMLCDEILSKQSYIDKTSSMGADIASANYQQIPIDIKGKLYSNFKTYEKLPPHFDGIYSYCDTADEGNDYLCNIVYGDFNHEAYILDVYYTKAAMETTEPETAQRLTDYNVTLATIESNNGGRGFARSVKNHLEKLHNYQTVIKWMHQSKNKQARIITASTWIMEHCYLPINWRDKWPEYYESMTTYQREGKNKNDDAPDATTGISELMNKPNIGSVNIPLH
jgi:predicted phage terminase large subunit-like protein